MEKLLEQILTQLRRQHHGGEHFNALTIVALVLQAIAALCLLGALWMGSGNLDLFMRWMGAGLLIQIAVIAALMFSSRMED